MEKILEKFNLTSKKGIENLVILLVLVVIVMVVINSLFTEKEEVTQIEQVVKQEVNSDSLEKKLENILTSIKGVGKVKVMISYTNSIEKVPIYDTKEVTTLTNELDSSGGKRETKETSNERKVVYEESGSNKNIVTKQNIMPEIIGVIVTAEGAEVNQVKENIINAVSAVTNIPSHKIQVFAQWKGNSKGSVK